MIENAWLPNNFGQLVSGLILSTKYIGLRIYPDARRLVDIDISILGQSEDRFDEYELQVRKEYSWVDEDAFRAARRKILEIMNDGQTIYLTPFFIKKYEEQARRNIARSLARLKK